MNINERIKQAEKHLKAWLDAELELTTHQSYSIGSRSLTKASLPEVRKQIEYWEKKLISLKKMKNKRGRNSIKQVIPRDL